MKVYCKSYGLNCNKCKREKCFDSRGKCETNLTVKCPAIYRNFKHEKNGVLNNYMYATIGVAEPIEKEKFHDVMDKAQTIIKAKHTETDKTVYIAIYNKKYIAMVQHMIVN